MIGISEYSVITGRHQRTVEDIASFYNSDKHNQMHKIGLDTIPTDNDRMLSDMISEACTKIQQYPDLILVAHSLPFIRISNSEYSYFNKKIPTYYLSGLPCVIMHKAVEIACKMISNKTYNNILVIGADKAYSDNERIFFDTIMGDAVVAILLNAMASNHHIISSEVSTTVIASEGENSSQEDIIRFRNMNVSLMRTAIQNCLLKAMMADVDRFVTHTSNRKFWDSMAIMMKCPRSKFLDNNISNTGHMNSHDSFLHYFHYYEKGIIQSGETSMLINPGFGGSQGCTIIKT